MAINRNFFLKTLLLVVIVIKSSISFCQIEMELGSKCIYLNNMNKKKIPINLCLLNKSDKNVYLNNVNKVIYDENDILKTLVVDPRLNNCSIMKYKLSDTLNNIQYFISIPGYTAKNEMIAMEKLKRYNYPIAGNEKISKRYVLDISNLKYKVKSGNNYFIQVFLINNTDTVYANSPLLLKVK
jgi:hypothetical protein